MNNLKILLFTLGAILLCGIIFDAIRRIRAFLDWSHVVEHNEPIEMEEVIDLSEKIMIEPIMQAVDTEVESIEISDSEELEDSLDFGERTLIRLPEYEDQVIALLIVGGNHGSISGSDLLQALLLQGCQYSEQGIFHRFGDGIEEGHKYFSVANLVEPGTFDLDMLKKQSVKGIALFFQFGETNHPLDAFERMLISAKAIAMTLKAELKDDKGRALHPQRLEHYRERVREYQRKLLAVIKERKAL